MLQNIPPEITIASFSAVGVLTGYIWNLQGKKIEKITKIQETRPCNTVCNKIYEIQRDIDWIKKVLDKKL